MVRVHGRIGMLGFAEAETISGEEEFVRKMDAHANTAYRLSATHLNARHLVYNQPKSKLPDAVYDLLIFLLDNTMPLGILSLDQLNY